MTGTVVRNGTQYVRLEATEATIPNTKQFSATALVTSDGHVRELSGSSVVNANDVSDTATRIGFAYEFRRVASSPVRPTWVRNVPRLSLHRVADGEGIAIHNAGERPVPAGTGFSIRATNWNVTDGEPVFRGTARLGQSLQPGKTQYLHAARVSGEVGFFAAQQETTRVNSAVFLSNRTITVDGRTENTRFLLVIELDGNRR
ncbi:hypothetical protein [Haladaptatus sp. DFWS20]|uniref:hypothetical protein n=1 Tax=Haladaptatus sp. DFWS20 TaxID=3403467 RepID=UPI003EBFB0F1